MKFWPVSEIARCVSPEYEAELRDFCYKMPSRGAYLAAMNAIQHAEPVHAPNLVTIDTVGGCTRRFYTGYPEGPEWASLERATVMDDNGCVFILMDALH
jgi:hypothetical protein